MLNLPIYIRNNSYYFHTRINGKQFKKSLKTSNKTLAIIKAGKLLEAIQMSIDWKNIKDYKIDMQRGIYEADGEEDHQNMMFAIEKIGMLSSLPSHQQKQEIAPQNNQNTLTLNDVLDKFFLLKKVKPATVTAYKNTVKEFVAFHQSKCAINEIISSDFVRYQEHLASGNSPRTIDNKITNLKAILNFAVNQGYISKNPLQVKNLQTKRQKLSDGYLIFEEQEITKIFKGEYFQQQKIQDPDYYYCLLLEIFTGCRIGELTSLKTEQLQQSKNGTYFLNIRESKTMAGVREIPLPQILFTQLGFNQFIAYKKNLDPVFKYVGRTGKGSGNAVGKKFKRHLEIENINRGKLVFHSLRKFLNDYLLKNNVDYEPRCQFMGHEVDNVNVATYAKKFNVDNLAEIIKPAIDKLTTIIL